MHIGIFFLVEEGFCLEHKGFGFVRVVVNKRFAFGCFKVIWDFDIARFVDAVGINRVGNIEVQTQVGTNGI